VTEKQYPNGLAMWRGAADKARVTARNSGRPTNELLREFVYERLLARVFADLDDPWVINHPWILKGGAALLVRVEDARHSKDVDLLARLHDIDDAVQQLRRALAVDLGDFFRFDIQSVQPTGGTELQPSVDGRTLTILPTVGLKRLEQFKIDLVTGSLMTADPELLPAPALVRVRGIAAPTYRLYPAVDHLADKLCATETIYAGGRASSRARDLVDIVIMARTQTVTLSALRTAVTSERLKRNLPHRSAFQAPAEWEESLYPKAASASRWSADLDFAGAVELAGRLLNPAFVDGDDARWDPTRGVWVTE
jgi:hypothetical protein